MMTQHSAHTTNTHSLLQNYVTIAIAIQVMNITPISSSIHDISTLLTHRILTTIMDYSDHYPFILLLIPINNNKAKQLTKNQLNNSHTMETIASSHIM